MPNTTSGTRFKIRDAEAENDAASVLSIYTPFITHSIASFEFDPPTEAEMKRRILSTQENFPWLICEAVNYNSENGNRSSCIAGYAYASKHRDRAGYQWVAETGIYVSEQFRGQGVGSILYEKLCTILSQQGYFQALAIISGDNEGSFAFHKRLGFQLVGTWKKYGNKFGKWCDVAWYGKQLQPEFIENPEKPTPYNEIKHLVSLQLDN